MRPCPGVGCRVVSPAISEPEDSTTRPPSGSPVKPAAAAGDSKIPGETRVAVLKPGARISRYVVRGRLGAGAMGEVYQARDERLERDVALKLLKGNQTGDPKAVRRFLREAKATSALNHPNIITVHELSDSEHGLFLAMELVEGWSLRVAIAERPALDSFQHVGRQLAQALKAAHVLGIAHRDIKPENVMVRPDGYVKLLDFGLARLAPTAQTHRGAPGTDETTEGLVIGSARYMSPEQARGDRVTTATDIFSLGLVLFEWAAGQHPFASVFAEEVLRGIATDDPPSLAGFRPDWPEEVNTLLHAMLSKAPELRPKAAEVESILAGLTPRSTSQTPVPISTRTSAPGSEPANSNSVQADRMPPTKPQSPLLRTNAAPSAHGASLWRLTHGTRQGERSFATTVIVGGIVLGIVLFLWAMRH